MAERDYAPLSAACVKSLNDKLYEKRKAAALEVEKMVKEFVAHNNTAQIQRLIKVLGQDFANAPNQHSRKGGLIGLAAIAVGLGPVHTEKYIEDLIFPILICFSDADSRVRYYACESLYNVIKVARGAILPLFTEIFGTLSKLACDTEQSVKNATELLDKLMKDIVTESDRFDFVMVGFIPVLRERIYTKNPFARMFIISWITVLDAVPDVDLIVFLPEVLDGLFKILEAPEPEIKKAADTVFADFLRSIKSNPSRVHFAEMINILITHAQSSDELLQLTAITWMDEFLRLSGQLLLPYTSGIFTAILPCLSYDDTHKTIKETASRVNDTLFKLIISNNEESDVADKLDLTSIIEVLTKQLMLSTVPVQTKVAVLKWLYHLLTNLPDKMYLHIEELFPVLLKSLSDNSDEVVQQSLVVMSELISSKSESGQNKYFHKFMVNLLRLFSADRHLLEERGTFIIRELCILLNAQQIFKVLADILRDEENYRFAAHMVQTLNTILLCTPELFDVRNKLKDFHTEECVEVFLGLYKPWCHNPVATVALCLLTQNYDHASELVKYFGNIEVTVEFLVEIDKLIQLIESPIFTYLRLELLEIERNETLVRTLYGLLMILPQSDAFSTLLRRLNAIPPRSSTISTSSSTAKSIQVTQSETMRSKINFKELFQLFVEVQEKHKEQKREQKRALMIDPHEHLEQLSS